MTQIFNKESTYLHLIQVKIYLYLLDSLRIVHVLSIVAPSTNRTGIEIQSCVGWYLNINVTLLLALEGEREMFYLTTHSTHFIYGYMASDIRLRTILIVRKETRCRHIGYSYRLTARVLLYPPSHRQDNTYHGLCYTSRWALVMRDNERARIREEGLY